MAEIENSQITSDSSDKKSLPYLQFRSDTFGIEILKQPIWLLGLGLHGPYTPDNVTMRNLRIHIKLFESLNHHPHSSSAELLAHRTKDCRVKFPQVVLPIFFDRPIKLWPIAASGYLNIA